MFKVWHNLVNLEPYKQTKSNSHLETDLLFITKVTNFIQIIYGTCLITWYKLYQGHRKVHIEFAKWWARRTQQLAVMI